MSIRTTCPYCGVGCGVIASKAGEGWKITGDPDHPANFGRLCSKGSNLAETLSLEGRLLEPEVGGKQVSWDTALDTVADKFIQIAREHGPESIAFYLSGQMLTEDYYTANKFAKGFIGTPNVDTNSRLCMASSVAGHKRAFGFDTVPQCYEDLDCADLIVLVGSNAAWCHPVLFQRIQKNRKERGAKLVTIDVRETTTTQESDLALIIKPGSDAFLFNGLLCALERQQVLDRDFIDNHCSGFDAALIEAKRQCFDIDHVAKATGLAPDDIEKFFAIFASTEKTVSCYSLGIHMSSSGTDKVNAIINCHLATGRIGKEGAGPLSLTGQPNAMGGREVGGLANQLAAHMGYDEVSIDRVSRFWDAPNIATGEGLKAVDMFTALGEGKIKAIWIISTNPAVSMTDALDVRRALQKCDIVVVSDCVSGTDTLHYADVKLPAAAWGEKGGTVTNSERRISRQRAFMKAPGGAKPDWWMIKEVAQRMGFGAGFNYRDESEIFAEHANLSAFENNGSRDFDIAGLCDLDATRYDRLEPVQWPVFKGANKGQKRLFADGRFFHDDGRARFIAVTPAGPIEQLSDEFPLALISGRVRDQWHSMTRSGKSKTLARHRAEPFVEIAPVDAQKFGLVHRGLAKITSRLASSNYRVRITKSQQKGTLFVPIHWNQANASGGLTGAFFASHRDPHSGQPEGKHVPVAIKPVVIEFTGLVISQKPLKPKLPLFWSRAAGKNCYLHSLAFDQPPKEGWSERVAAFLQTDVEDLVIYEDRVSGIFRAAHFVDDKIEAAVFIAPGFEPLEEVEAERWFNSDKPAANNRWMSLSPLPAGADSNKGATICACFSVGANAIRDAIVSGRATTVEDIGQLLSAGTNCGSCVPEISQIIHECRNADTNLSGQ